MNNVVLKHFYKYNFRRYSTPWVCKMNPTGTYNFNDRVGLYTGKKGEEGDVIVFSPEAGQVYAYGQKDYRGNDTCLDYALWDGTRFVPCDKIGRVAAQG